MRSPVSRARGLRRALAAGFVLVAVLAPLEPDARAVDLPKVGGKPVSADITNTAILNYHFDNRNDSANSVGERVDDYYGDFIDKLNLQLAWWRLTLYVRFDVGTFFATPTLVDASDIAAAHGQDPNLYYRELHTRYQTTLYPTKFWLSYTQPGVEVTAGDFYAQLGRGLVFSVRKIDELAIDTTVRGGKITADHDFGKVRVGATAFAGQLNPLRTDESSGRILNGYDSPFFFGFPRSNGLVTYVPDTVNRGGPQIRTVDKARPSYLEDSVVGGHVEAGNDIVLAGANGSILFRRSYEQKNLACHAACGAPTAVTYPQCVSDCDAEFPSFSSTNVAKTHDTIRTFSGSLTFPKIGKFGDLYAEVAGQQLRDGRVLALDDRGKVTDRDADISGYAVYGSATVRGGPVTVALEGKHYRRFFPLSGNIDTASPGFSAPEYNVITYNNPPTAEPIYVQPLGAPQICNTGGRAKVDYRYNPRVSVYGWFGYYVSFSEVDAVNNDCSTAPEKRTNDIDVAFGTDLDLERGQSHAKAWVGIREDDLDVPSDAGPIRSPTSVFYREGYIRYDLTKHVSGPFSLQAQGFHLRRYEPGSIAEPWYEGENYTALHWSPHFSFIFGYEYQTKEGCEPGNAAKTICHYFSGGAQWKSASTEKFAYKLFDTVNLFVGQRRGAIRCVSGVCRQFPPFEGAKIELVSRF